MVKKRIKVERKRVRYQERVDNLVWTFKPIHVPPDSLYNQIQNKNHPFPLSLSLSPSLPLTYKSTTHNTPSSRVRRVDECRARFTNMSRFEIKTKGNSAWHPMANAIRHIVTEGMKWKREREERRIKLKLSIKGKYWFYFTTPISWKSFLPLFPLYTSISHRDIAIICTQSPMKSTSR